MMNKLQQLFYTLSGHIETTIIVEKTSAEVEQALKDTLHRGIGIGEGHVPPPVYVQMCENTCKKHEMPLQIQTVQLANGTLIEVWICPMWQEHSTAPMPTVQRFPYPDPGERHTDRIPQPNSLQVVHHALKTGAGTHTAVQQAVTRDLLKYIKGETP